MPISPPPVASTADSRARSATVEARKPAPTAITSSTWSRTAVGRFPMHQRGHFDEALGSDPAHEDLRRAERRVDGPGLEQSRRRPPSAPPVSAAAPREGRSVERRADTARCRHRARSPPGRAPASALDRVERGARGPGHARRRRPRHAAARLELHERAGGRLEAVARAQHHGLAGGERHLAVGGVPAPSRTRTRSVASAAAVSRCASSKTSGRCPWASRRSRPSVTQRLVAGKTRPGRSAAARHADSGAEPGRRRHRR